MAKRYAVLWFPRLAADRRMLRQPSLQGEPFVLVGASHGRMLVRSVSRAAAAAGIMPGMVVADARAVFPELLVFPDDEPATASLLEALAAWCIRYTPVVATDPPDGLILDISGCAHLWGGESAFLEHLSGRLRRRGYTVCMAIADTIGTAWAVAHYGQSDRIIESGQQATTLAALPPAALRLPEEILQRLHKLGFQQIGALINIPDAQLRRRFGPFLLTRMRQALGQEVEFIKPLEEFVPFQERLPCLEPIRTAKSIEIALKKLLDRLCDRLRQEGQGLRTGVLHCYRMDGIQQQITIGTNQASAQAEHLFKLFELRIATIRPGLGIELFVLEAGLTETVSQTQESLWQPQGDMGAVAALLDHIANKLGADTIRRYLPAEHHWPERSVVQTSSLTAQPETNWDIGKPRPALLFSEPEPIEVMVPLPDYPPVQFRYKQQWHQVKKADGPERIEREWWLEQGQPRDYYCVEDEAGGRYWIFRLGLYTEGEPKWFVHGVFA